MIFGTSYSPYFGGIELVTITWSNWEFLMFYKAFPKITYFLPENNPWVAKDETERAPFYFKTFVASHNVPPVSIISSIIMAFLFYTLPTKCILPIFPAPILCLIIMANVDYLTPTEDSNPKKFFALVTPPASGDITTISFKSNRHCSTK